MKDCTFKFRFKETDHTADVLISRSNDFPLHLHITNVKPKIQDLPDVCYLIYESKRKDFNVFIFNHSNELANKMLEGIKKYCLENRIDLSS